MKKKIIKILLISLLVWLRPDLLKADHYGADLSGRILLQVEENGEAWYVYPENNERYYLGSPADAFLIMKKLSLGVTSEFINQTEIFPVRLAGMILLDAQANGEAYYINPITRQKHYLGSPVDAWNLMRDQSLGIRNKDLVYLPIGSLDYETGDLPTYSARVSGVPFISQAPFNEWHDPRQQDGCEETSALMVVKWARGEAISNTEARDEIIRSSDYIKNKYGIYRDVSIKDTLNWLLEDYFNFKNATLVEDITIAEMVKELHNGNVIIAPFDGLMIHNSFYTEPDPPRHMLVIIGYDAEKEVFITHDPGTHHGENFAIDARVFYNSMRDYPSGYHELIKEVKKDVIIVEK